MARLSTRLAKEVEQAKTRLEALKAKHEQERRSMEAAESHAEERVKFLTDSHANALKFEGSVPDAD